MEERTKKEFFPYNEYQDRGMSLKWGTAFELGELTKAIKESTEESNKSFERLPQMTTEDIDYYLYGSIKYNKVLEIQLNSLDHLGRVKDPIIGNFRGMVAEGIALVGNTEIDYQDIRHIIQHDYQKWFDLNNEPH